MAFQIEAGVFYTIVELEKAGIASRFTLRKWIKNGRLKASLVGRKYLISGEDIRDFLLSGSGASQRARRKELIKQEKQGGGSEYR